MQVLVLGRVFSGFVQMLEEGGWAPRGTPAVYRLYEALQKDPEIDVVFVLYDADGFLAKQGLRSRRVDLAGFGTVYVVSGPWFRWPRLLRRVGGVCRELHYLISALSWYRVTRADLVYAYNATALAGSVIARNFRGAVALRLLGLHPFHWRIAGGGGWFSRVFRAPYRQVVCSRDGSGGTHYLPLLTGPQVPVEVVLNGCDAEDNVEEIRFDESGPLKVVFLGRLEPNKGGREFVSGIAKALQRSPKSVSAMVIGDGSERQSLAEEIARHGLEEDCRLLGSLPHSDVQATLQSAHLYVSLNRFGNLSNATLEAMRTGLAVAILEEDQEWHIDSDTAEILDPKTIPRILREGTDDSLADLLVDMASDRDRLANCANSVRDAAARHLKTWDERIEWECALLKRLASE